MSTHPMNAPTPAGRDESGFTLIELVVAAAISFLIAGALAGAVVIGLRTTDASSQRLSQTKDVQLVQGSLPRDVLSATGVQTNVAALSTCSNHQSLLVLTWSTWALGGGGGAGPPTTGAVTTYEADYYYTLVSPAAPAKPMGTLTRGLYTGTVGSCSVVSSRVLADKLSKDSALQTATYASPTVTLTLTDSTCSKYSASAQTRSATTTTTAVPTTTTAAPACTG